MTNTIPQLVTSNRKARIKMLFRFVNPVIKIISSQEFIGRLLHLVHVVLTDGQYGTTNGQKYGGIP